MSWARGEVMTVRKYILLNYSVGHSVDHLISLIFTAYFIYQTRQHKATMANTSNTDKERDNSNDFYDDVGNVDA